MVVTGLLIPQDYVTVLVLPLRELVSVKARCHFLSIQLTMLRTILYRQCGLRKRPGVPRICLVAWRRSFGRADSFFVKACHLRCCWPFCRPYQESRPDRQKLCHYKARMSSITSFRHALHVPGNIKVYPHPQRVFTLFLFHTVVDHLALVVSDNAFHLNICMGRWVF